MNHSPWRSGRLALVTSMALSVLVGLAAPTTAQDRTQLSFAFWGDPAEFRAYEDLQRAFEAVNPDIDVRSEYIPGQSEYQTRIATSFAAGNPPDIFLINFRRYGQYAATGAISPLGSRLEASETLAIAEFWEQPIDAFTFEGELYCIPQNISSLVIYYNIDMFERAGVPLPQPGWTWDEFLQAAIALTQDINGDGFIDQYGAGISPELIRAAPFIWGAGGDLVDDVDNPTQLTIDTPEARAGIQFFIDLSLRYEVVPTEPEVLAEDDQSRFMNGRTAMFFQSRRPVPTLREITSFSWDVAPMPVGPAGPATVLHSDAFCMSASADQDAAWRFIEYAVGVEGQTLLAATGRTVPSLISVAESPAFLQATGVSESLSVLDSFLPPRNSGPAYLDTIPYIQRVPNISTWPEVEDAFNSTIGRAFYGEVSVDDAIAVAQARSADAFERARRE